MRVIALPGKVNLFSVTMCLSALIANNATSAELDSARQLRDSLRPDLNGSTP